MAYDSTGHVVETHPSKHYELLLLSRIIRESIDMCFPCLAAISDQLYGATQGCKGPSGYNDAQETSSSGSLAFVTVLMLRLVEKRKILFLFSGSDGCIFYKRHAFERSHEMVCLFRRPTDI